MSRVVFQFVTVECDSADQALLEQLRALLPGVVVATPAPPTAAPEPTAAKAIANHLLEGSLQELCLEAAQHQPGLTAAELASAVLNDTTPSAKTRVGMALSPLVTRRP